MGAHRTPNAARRFKLPRRRWLALGGLVAALAIAVPVALASDLFTDVPNSNAFHDDIGAIARAGITTGKTCSPPGTPPTYCPSENVTREAMAAFMHRGFGRVAFGTASSVSPGAGTDAAILTVPITVGLPGTALAGAAAFVKADAEVRVDVSNATGCPCRVRVSLKDADTDTFIDGDFYAAAVVDSAQTQLSIPITGVGAVTTSGVHNFEVVAAQTSGTGTTVVNANLSLTYVPFGSTGTNTLSTSQSASTRSDK